MDMQPAQRLQKLPPYLFAALRKRIAEARSQGVKVITLGIGDPDQPTPDAVIEELIRAVTDTDDPDRHRYGCDAIVDAWPAAIRRFYKHQWGVELGEENLATTMGSKDAIVKFCMGLLNPGDVGIAPVPGYPTYNIGHVFCSATTFPLPLRAQNGFLPDFQEIPADIRRQAKVLWLNYPNNPTTATADVDFFAEAVQFGRENDILIAHDAAYNLNTYDGYQAPSILQVDGADEVAVEFFSLSKAYNMTGWRMGCVAGNASAIAALQRVKNNVDNGSMRAVQFAAARALDLSDEILPKVNEVYRRRRDQVVDALNQAGWQLAKPKATIYVWAPVPEAYNGSSAAFAEDLLNKTGVVVTPGLGYGQWGEGHFRISLTYPDEVLTEAVGRIAEMKV
jgi:LL-diaminopimelate aminotransferase